MCMTVILKHYKKKSTTDGWVSLDWFTLQLQLRIRNLEKEIGKNSERRFIWEFIGYFSQMEIYETYIRNNNSKD